jgi:UDP-N-acetylmuramate dehydrogenase
MAPPCNFHGAWREQEPLARHTSLRVGGPADYWLETDSTDDLLHALTWARDQSVPVLALGNGTNVLIPDEGFRGLALKMPTHFRTTESRTILADAGCPLPTLVHHCAKLNWGGMEFLTGIPGTVGGAVITNAGAHGHEISEFLFQLTAIAFPSLETRTFQNQDCLLGYRHSVFLTDRQWLIVEVEFRLPNRPLDTQQMSALTRWRQEKQPILKPNAGSVFKNPPGHFAGALIEQHVGKGFAIGPAAISDEHANIFVNRGGATASDFRDLIQEVQTRVKNHTGIPLELEWIVL